MSVTSNKRSEPMLLPTFLLSVLSTKVTTTREVSEAFHKALDLTGMKVDRAAWLMGISRPQLIAQLSGDSSAHLSVQRMRHMRREADGREFESIFRELLDANENDEEIAQIVARIQASAAALADKMRLRMAKATLKHSVIERRTA